MACRPEERKKNSLFYCGSYVIFSVQDGADVGDVFSAGTDYGKGKLLGFAACNWVKGAVFAGNPFVANDFAEVCPRDCVYWLCVRIFAGVV